MANNQENFTGDDITEDIDINYQNMNPNENNEGIVEYLVLDLEIDNVQDAEEYATQIVHTPSNKSRMQSSVLKTNYTGQTRTKRISKSKSLRIKPADVTPERSIARTRSSNETDGNFNTQVPKQRSVDRLESSTVHAAVNDINSRLADSIKSLNGYDAKDRTLRDTMIRSPVAYESSNEDSMKKSDLDGLDLFFQSMAQTVMTLPSQVQAKIKMDICKVIAMAEMKYCTSDTSQEVDKD